MLRCPYHGWTYGHDGQLVGVPEARGFDDLDRDAVALPQFSLGVLAGLVFVNLDADAEPLAGWFGELGDAPRGVRDRAPARAGAGTSTSTTTTGR